MSLACKPPGATTTFLWKLRASEDCSKQWHDTITGLIWNQWGRVKTRKWGYPPLGLHRGKRCSGICPTARQKNPHSSICDDVAGGLLCSHDLCSLTSVLWMEGLANTAAMKWCLKRSTGEFFSTDPIALVFIVHPQSSGVSETQKPQLYPTRTVMLKLQLRMSHTTGRGKALSAKSCIFQMWFSTFQYLMPFINVTWRLAVTYSRLLQRWSYRSPFEAFQKTWLICTCWR